jgi:predicted MFS family arabinose efflux permease
LFAIWSVTALLLEVPSGALADLVSRQRLLVIAAAVYACVFAVWAAAPSYPAFALGFVLWGASGAVVSGTYQSYVYDVLAAHDEARRYQQVLARGRALAFVSSVAAMVAAAPLIAVGGYPLVAGVSVGACVVQALVAASMPPDRRSGADDADQPGYFAMLRSGLAEAHGSVPVRHAVIVAALIPGLLAFDEYFPLLARDLGATESSIPLLMAVTVAVQAVGAVLGERAGPAMVAPALLTGAVLTVLGTLSGHPAGFLVIAAGYALGQLSMVVAETRLQAVIRGPARATVTSVSGLLSELCAIATFAAFAVGAAWLSLVSLVGLLAAAWLPLTLATRRWFRR